jgi:hypothetical protein
MKNFRKKFHFASHLVDSSLNIKKNHLALIQIHTHFFMQKWCFPLQQLFVILLYDKLGTDIFELAVS